MTKDNIVKALGYEPPVEDTQGVNLVLDSAEEITNQSYEIADYTLQENLIIGNTYTFTIWGELATEKDFFSVHTKSPSRPLGRLDEISDGIYSVSFKVEEMHMSTPTDLGFLRVYAAPSNVSGVTSTIHRVKLEPGTVPNPIWTPSPHDVAVKSELKDFPRRNLLKNSENINVTRIDTGANYLREKFMIFINTDYGISLIRKGGAFTLSCDYEINGITTPTELAFGITGVTGGNEYIYPGIQVNIGNNSGRYEVTFYPSDNVMGAGGSWILGGFIAGKNANVNIILKNAKLEKGDYATTKTPAPEDVVVRSELEALIKRVDALETKVGITSADSMELPSMDVVESGSETASADDAEDDMEIN